MIQLSRRYNGAPLYLGWRHIVAVTVEGEKLDQVSVFTVNGKFEVAQRVQDVLTRISEAKIDEMETQKQVMG